MIRSYKYLLLSCVLFAACSDDDSATEGENLAPITSGQADFSTFVALGNSLTAGYADNALFRAGQDNSFSKLLADQFALAGGGEFRIPYMNDNIGGLLLGGNVIAGPRLYFNGTGPVPVSGVPTTEVGVTLTGPFNNLGVPGAKSFHLLAPGYGDIAGIATGTANPYFARFRSSASTSVLQDAMAQQPTFFSLWIGNNDVLGYATTGGDGTNPITSETMFQTAYTTLVTQLTSGGAKGVVANIPNVVDIPHFRTVPYNPLAPTNPAFGPMIPTLNATFAPLNQAFAFLGVPERSIVFSETQASAVIVHDETLPNLAVQLTQVLQAGGLDATTATLLGAQFGQARQAKPTDLFVLPASSAIATVNQPYFNFLVSQGVPAATAGQLAINGVTFPLEDKWVLLPSEQQEIDAATTLFNNIIRQTAENHGLAFVDANAVLRQLATGGIRFGSYHMSSTFVTGGAFSLDGIHLSPRANAHVANLFMEAINETYGSTLRPYSPENFPGQYGQDLN